MAPTPLELAPDCSRCFALCCVLLPYRQDAGFGADKPGGVACHHLADDDRCTIHTDLRARGWSGCAVFDCLGAGQHVSQVTYGGRSWREGGDRGEMAAVLTVVRRVHEMLRHLAEVATRSPDPAAADLAGRLLVLRDATPVELLTTDVEELHDECGDLLARASSRLRPPGAADLRGVDLAGRDLRRRDLAGALLRGAVLIGADLRGADLGPADLLGADLRGADVRGTQLSGALFLTQSQLEAARGDATTTVPAAARRPAHWG